MQLKNLEPVCKEKTESFSHGFNTHWGLEERNNCMLLVCCVGLVVDLFLTWEDRDINGEAAPALGITR